MKTKYFQMPLPVIAAAVVLVFAAGTVAAQDASPASPQLAYGVSQVVQLSKANVGEDTIITYVQNSGNSYGLGADQIVYLKQQGVSANVINAMINQHSRTVATAPAATSSDSQASYTTTPAPAVTYVQPAPAPIPSSSVYVMPDTQTYDYYTYYYNPYYYGSYGYGWPYPGVSLSFEFGGGYRGGYYGGYRGGGGFRGGGFHGGGGGFHGGFRR